jgi:hypothetical protein
MVAQRTNGQLFPALRNSANASVRLRSSFCLFLAHSHFAAARQWSSRVTANAARLSYDQNRDVGSAPCHGYNPHRQPSLLHPPL